MNGPFKKPMKNQKLSIYSEVELIVKRLDEIVKEDKEQWEPNQGLSYLHNDIEEFIFQADKFFNADEDPDPCPITAEERLNEAWEQKMEAKG